MGALKVFTGVATIGTAVLLAVKGYCEVREGVKDIQENGLDIPDLDRIGSVLEGVKESLESLEPTLVEVA